MDLHSLYKQKIRTLKISRWPFYVYTRIDFLKNWNGNGGKLTSGVLKNKKQVKPGLQ